MIPQATHHILHRKVISISAVDEVRNTPHNLDLFCSLPFYRYAFLRDESLRE